MSGSHVTSFVLGAILALTSAPAGASQAAPLPDQAPPPAAATSFNRPPDRDPYKKLFPAAPIDGLRQAPARAARAAKVVCGTLMIPADDSIDPGIRVGKPRSTTKYAIDAVEPPICRDK